MTSKFTSNLPIIFSKLFSYFVSIQFQKVLVHMVTNCVIKPYGLLNSPPLEAKQLAFQFSIKQIKKFCGSISKEFLF